MQDATMAADARWFVAFARQVTAMVEEKNFSALRNRRAIRHEPADAIPASFKLRRPFS